VVTNCPASGGLREPADLEEVQAEGLDLGQHAEQG
jgi:hypothetical protein